MGTEMLINTVLSTSSHAQSVDGCIKLFHRALLDAGSDEHKWEKL